MHSKRSSSNNLQHRENADGDHQAETKKRFVAAEAHCTATRPICVHYLGVTFVCFRDDVLNLWYVRFHSVTNLCCHSRRSAFTPLCFRCAKRVITSQVGSNPMRR